MQVRVTQSVRVTFMVILAALAFLSAIGSLGYAQMPQHSTQPKGLLPPPRSNETNIIPVTSSERKLSGGLPADHGQIWREYDIRAYSDSRRDVEHPERTIVDWILRETGTEAWFSDPLGVLNANRHTIRVYHTPEMQQMVEGIVQRFVRPETMPHIFGVNLVTVSSPNWRARAVTRMYPVPVQSPGVEAWLLSREDAAVLMADLRKRTDFREFNSPNLLIGNGQEHNVSRQRPVAYVRNLGAAAGTLNPMSMGQIQEGFTLTISPLMDISQMFADAVIKCESTQVERMKNVSVSAPTAQNPKQLAQIKVPQTSSWRLHERFRWPANQVLLISCGVVASPGPDGKPYPRLVNQLLPKAPRSDALLFLEAKGRSSQLVTTGERQAETVGNLNYRGRY